MARRKKRAAGGDIPPVPPVSDDDVEITIEADGQDITPIVDPETGIVQIPDEDGGITIDFSGRGLDDDDDGPGNHGDNLALKIDEREQGRIAEMLLDAIEADKQDRQQWVTQRAKLIELLGMKLEEPKSDVSGSTMGMSTSVVRDPILLEAVERGRANAFAELCPAAGPVKVQNWEPEIPGSDELAKELENDLNFYLCSNKPGTATEYYPDTRYMLWWTYLASGTFKKVYKCPIRRRPVSEYVAGTDLIVPTNATDLKNAGRITHEVMMRRAVLRKMQLDGIYKDFDLTDPVPPTPNSVAQKIATTEGRKATPQRPEDQDYTLYECYCELDIQGYEHKDNGKVTGLPLPYRVTIEVDSRKVLEIRRNWDEDDEDYTATIPFVLFPFSTGLSRIYGSGLGHMGGNIAAALTALLRISIDAGMISNYPGLLIAKSSGRQLSNEIVVPPGGAAFIDTGGLPIQQTAMGMPYKDASPVVGALMDSMRQVGQRLLGSADMPSAEGTGDIPVGTILATIEQAQKIMAGAHKALHDAQAEEFQLLVELFEDDPEALWRGNDRPAMGEDLQQRIAKFKQAVDAFDISPKSDPNVPSALHRKLLALGFKQLTAGNPVYDPVKVDRFVAREAFQMGEQEFDSFLAPPPPPQAQPTDPRIIAAQIQAQQRMRSDALQAQNKEKLAAMSEATKQQQQQIDAAQAAIAGHVDMLKMQNAKADRESKENLAMVNTAKEIITATSVHPETEGAVDQQLEQWLPYMQPKHDNEPDLSLLPPNMRPTMPGTGTVQ